MKVAIIHNQLSRGGGMETYMFSLLQGFVRAGDEVHVHTYEVDRDFTSKYDFKIHLTRVGFLPRRLRKYFFINKYNREFDSSEYDLSLSLTRTACQDISVIGGVHPASVLTRSTSNFYRRAHDRIETRFERIMFKRVPCIVAHSNSIANQITEFYNISDKKIHVLYPPVDNHLFERCGRDQIDATRKIYDINPDKMTFLFPSVGHERKGLPELLSAFARVSQDDFKLLVAGESIRSKVKLPKNVRYVGYIENLSALYSSVDYVILPSHYEPFGLVVIESLQCGTPVIVTRGVGAAEVITEAEGIVMENNYPETIVETITGVVKKQVPPDFIQRRGLTIEQHIDKIKNMTCLQQRT